MERGIIIIGSGQAGTQLAFSLRDEGYTGPVTLIGDEAWLPYQRPPLSKGYLQGIIPSDRLNLRSAETFQSADITLRLGCRVTALDQNARRVTLHDGSMLQGDELVLATGSRPRMLPDASKPRNLHVLRSRDDADALGAALSSMPGGRLVIIGGGFIGLEVACVAREKFGLEVDVLEREESVLRRAVSAPTAANIAHSLQSTGVRIHTSVIITRTEKEYGTLRALHLKDGRVITADVVLLGIGGIANGELLGGGAEGGVLVDEWLQAAPHLHAIGDCARFPDSQGRHHRVESVQNAIDQGRWLARRLTRKVDQPFAALNWFWSDIGALKLQIAGLRADGDEVEHFGAPDTSRAISCVFRDGTMVAVETLNRPADHMIARRLLASERRVSREMVRSAGGELRDVKG